MLKTVQFLAIFSLFSISVSFAQSNIKKDSPLIQAVKADNKKEVKRLLKSGVDVNELGQDYKTALDAAVEYGYADIAISLIKNKGKVVCSDNQKYLIQLCKERSSALYTRFPLMMLASIAVVGVSIQLVFFGLLFAPWQAGYYIYSIFFISYCILGAGLILYTVSLPIQAHSWSLRSEQSWILPISE